MGSRGNGLCAAGFVAKRSPLQTDPTVSLWTSCDSLCQARSDYCFAMVKEASSTSRLGLPVFVLSASPRRGLSDARLAAGSGGPRY